MSSTYARSLQTMSFADKLRELSEAADTKALAAKKLEDDVNRIKWQCENAAKNGKTYVIVSKYDPSKYDKRVWKTFMERNPDLKYGFDYGIEHKHDEAYYMFIYWSEKAPYIPGCEHMYDSLEDIC